MRDDPNPRRALVVGAADAAYWVMQRTLVELLVRKGFMSKDTLCGIAKGSERKPLLI